MPTTIKLGDTGDDVKRLQRVFARMKVLGPDDVDGVFGPQTASLPTRSPSQPRTAARKAGVLDLESSSGRETDSPLEERRFEPAVPLARMSLGLAKCPPVRLPSGA
jgi:hypothetical protein